MLRALLGENKRGNDPQLAAIFTLIGRFGRTLRERYPCSGEVDGKWIRLDIWATGLGTALNELEQSVFCSKSCRTGITAAYEEEMDEDEEDRYYRYVYFYKNAFIRIFSILDKTGHFLDLLFDAQTAQVKSKFSYFTVLRQLYTTKNQPELEKVLFKLKVQYKEPLNRLRRKRNLEIHAMNAELIDDVWRQRACFADRRAVEPLDAQLDDLQAGYTMVCQSLQHIFAYAIQSIRR